MTLQIDWTSRLVRLEPLSRQFAHFAQRMANRLVVGTIRYDLPDRRKRYLTRLELEVKAYKRTGNAEHLYNAANYCVLESVAPQHPRFHHDGSAPSVTRGKREVEGD
jgi:hypothetical protein